MFGLILSFIAKLGGTVTGYLFKKKIADIVHTGIAAKVGKDVIVAELQTGAELYRTRADLLKSFKWTQWLIFAALVPPILHQGMVFLDSTPFPYIDFDYIWPTIKMHVQGSWGVVKAPAPYDEREWQLIASLLGIQGGLSVGMAFLKFLFARK